MLITVIFRIAAIVVIVILGLFAKKIPEFYFVKPSGYENLVISKEEAARRVDEEENRKQQEKIQIVKRFDECFKNANALSEEDLFNRFVKLQRTETSTNVKPMPIGKYREEMAAKSQHISAERCRMQKCSSSGECTIAYTRHNREFPGSWAPVNKAYVNEFYDKLILNNSGVYCGSPWTLPTKNKAAPFKEVVKCEKHVCRFQGKRKGTENYCLDEESFEDFSKKCFEGFVSGCIEAIKLNVDLGKDQVKLEEMACKLGQISRCYDVAITRYPFEQAKFSLNKSCIDGLNQACFSLAMILWNSQREESLKLFSKVSVSENHYYAKVDSFLENMVAVDEGIKWSNRSCYAGESGACANPEKYTREARIENAVSRSCRGFTKSSNL